MKKAKVFIKDIGEITEETWEVDDDILNKFADKNGYLYAIFVYENGKK